MVAYLGVIIAANVAAAAHESGSGSVSGEEIEIVPQFQINDDCYWDKEVPTTNGMRQCLDSGPEIDSATCTGGCMEVGDAHYTFRKGDAASVTQAKCKTICNHFGREMTPDTDGDKGCLCQVPYDVMEAMTDAKHPQEWWRFLDKDNNQIPKGATDTVTSEPEKTDRGSLSVYTCTVCAASATDEDPWLEKGSNTGALAGSISGVVLAGVFIFFVGKDY